MSNKKKILFVINSLGCGGAEKSLVSLLPLFDYSEYEIHLQMFNIGGIFMDLLPKEVTVLPEIPYYVFLKKSLKNQILSGNVRFLKARLNASAAFAKNRKSQNKRHDTEIFWEYCHKVIISSDIHYHAAIAWGQGNPTHYVAEKVNADKKIAFINVNYKASGHDREFDFPYYSKYDKIISVSNELLELNKQVFPELQSKMEMILDIQNQNVIYDMAKDPIDFPPKQNIRRIVTVGRMTAQKGYDLAADACRKLIKSTKDFEWLIIGEGSERAKIEQMIKDYNLQNHLFLLGAKSNPYPYINSADIYVQTSRFEGYCLTLAEARTLNKPIVTTNFDVVNEQIISGKNGIITDMNGESIAKGILRLMTDNDLRESIIDYLKAEKKGNLEEFEKYLKIIEE